MEQRIAALRDEAIGSLAGVPTTEHVRDELTALALFVTDRVT